MPAATSETSSPKDIPTTKHPIIPPEEAADPLKPLPLLVAFEPAPWVAAGQRRRANRRP
jgi:hypothetical protein